MYRFILVSSQKHSDSTARDIIKPSPQLVLLPSVHIGRCYRTAGYILRAALPSPWQLILWLRFLCLFSALSESPKKAKRLSLHCWFCLPLLPYSEHKEAQHTTVYSLHQLIYCYPPGQQGWRMGRTLREGHSCASALGDGRPEQTLPSKAHTDISLICGKRESFGWVRLGRKPMGQWGPWERALSVRWVLIPKSYVHTESSESLCHFCQIIMALQQSYTLTDANC